MSDNPKDDDWGMTMPNVRLDDELKKDAPPSQQPVSAPQAPSLPPDDWDMTAPNINVPSGAIPPSQASSQPFDDYDKTAPNIDVPPQYTDKPKASDDDWGLSQANVNITKEDKKNDDWQMPAPTFRVSEGAKPNFDKTMPNFNLKDENFGSPYGDDEEVGNKTTPYYRLPENREEPAAQAPVVEKESEATPTAKPAAAPQKSGNMKWVLMLGGLFAFFVLIIVAIVAVYFLYFNTANTVKSTANKSNEAAPTPAPTVAATPAAAALPTTINYKGDMVLVAAGEFTMGSDTGGDESKPAHKVTVPAFYIDKTEVTNAQYKEFCDATKHSYPISQNWNKNYFAENPNAPVIGVSFEDAKAYAEWAGKRLPTEEEWEKAASWDATTQSKFDFPWGNEFDKTKAAFNLSLPSDVGSFPSGASPSGALDMAGNVAEWVDAFFQPYPGNSTQNDNFGEKNRVVRGGNFFLETNDSLKTTKRVYVSPDFLPDPDFRPDQEKASYIGFRCAVSAKDPRLQSIIGK